MTRADFMIVVFIAATLAGCAADGGTGSLAIAFDTSGLTGPMSPGDGSMTDEDGLAHLEWFPVFLVVRVTAADMGDPVVATWPEEIPGSLGSEVALDIEVPAGDAREVTLDLLLVDEDGVTGTFVSPAPGARPQVVDVAAGATQDLDITPRQLPTGTVAATWSGVHPVASVSWIDDRVGVVLPPSQAEAGSATTTLSIGRIYWPRVELDDGTVLDLQSQRVVVSTEGQIVAVELHLE
jgi:hypothetical protein